MISHFFTRPFYIESAAQKRKDLREFRLMLIFPRGEIFFNFCDIMCKRLCIFKHIFYTCLNVYSVKHLK